MQTNKPIQKKDKDDTTSPRSKKDKPQKQDRYKFQFVPLPQKFVNPSKMYRLYGDLIILESGDHLVLESSLYNYYKIYPRVEIENNSSQKLARVYLENKDKEVEDWRGVVEKIKNSDSVKVRTWAESIKAYCERFEESMPGFQGQISNEKIAKLKEINAQTQKIRQTLIETYPVLECKSLVRDGDIQTTEIAYGENYLAELGYTVEELVNTVFKGGLPMLFPFNAVESSLFARMGLDQSLPMNAEGFQSPESEICIVSKDGLLKTVKQITRYHMIYEKDTVGFISYSLLTGKSKAYSKAIKPLEKQTVTKDFVNASSEKEMEHADFLELFYGIRTEHR